MTSTASLSAKSPIKDSPVTTSSPQSDGESSPTKVVAPADFTKSNAMSKSDAKPPSEHRLSLKIVTSVQPAISSKSPSSPSLVSPSSDPNRPKKSVSFGTPLYSNNVEESAHLDPYSGASEEDYSQALEESEEIDIEQDDSLRDSLETGTESGTDGELESESRTDSGSESGSGSGKGSAVVSGTESDIEEEDGSEMLEIAPTLKEESVQSQPLTPSNLEAVAADLQKPDDKELESLLHSISTKVEISARSEQQLMNQDHAAGETKRLISSRNDVSNGR